jgi:hypothetical protein
MEHKKQTTIQNFDDIDWMNDESIPLVEHIRRVNAFDFAAIPAELHEIYWAHQLTIRSMEERLQELRTRSEQKLARRATQQR